jgi:hypothetical protein
VTNVVSNIYSMGAGTVTFYTTDIMNPVFTIDFEGGLFVNPFTAAASEIVGDFVDFGGPDVPSGLTNEQFSFSLANAVQTANGWYYTSAFTSSAVPEPGTLIALGAGLAALAARRRASK